MTSPGSAAFSSSEEESELEDELEDECFLLALFFAFSSFSCKVASIIDLADQIYTGF